MWHWICYTEIVLKKLTEKLSKKVKVKTIPFLMLLILKSKEKTPNPKWKVMQFYIEEEEV